MMARPHSAIKTDATGRTTHTESSGCCAPVTSDINAQRKPSSDAFLFMLKVIIVEEPPLSGELVEHFGLAQLARFFGGL